MNRFLFVLIVVVSANAGSAELCEFTKQEIEYFEFTENYPFSDRDYTPENVNQAKTSQAAYEAGKKVEYYIPENIQNIIKGGELQQAMLEAQKALKDYGPSHGPRFDREHYNLTLKYLTARKEYCDFRRSHYAVDW